MGALPLGKESEGPFKYRFPGQGLQILFDIWSRLIVLPIDAAAMISDTCGHCLATDQECVPEHFHGALPIPYSWRLPSSSGFHIPVSAPSHTSLGLSRLEVCLLLDVYDTAMVVQFGCRRQPILPPDVWQ